MLNPTLVNYIESEIIPIYATLNDASHDAAHIYQVIANSLEIAHNYSVSLDIVYTVAAYHDIGLLRGRDNHESHSKDFVYMDTNLAQFFNQEEIHLIAEAVEDHRDSLEYPPRSIYGKIVSEADRDIDFYRILKRTIQWGFQYSALEEEACIENSYRYMIEKYGPESGISQSLHHQANIDKLAQLHQQLQDQSAFHQLGQQFYRETVYQLRSQKE